MDLSQIKMVVTDMDGTLLNSKHEVSQRFFELFDELKKKEIIFVAASGRQYDSMVSKLNTIKDDIIFIAENGALIKKNDNTLLATPLDHNYIAKVLDLVKPISNAHPVLCSLSTAYVHNSSEHFIDVLQEYYTAFTPVANLNEVDDQIMKIAIFHYQSSESYVYPTLKHLEEDLKVKVSGANWIDVSHPDAHKGYALSQLMQHYEIKGSELLVFGDYNNDLEMLELAEFSVAMANAHPNIKKTANYETLSNNAFGVEKILEKLI